VFQVALSLVKGRSGDLWVLIEHWELHLRAANRSPKTIRSYIDTARMSFAEYLVEHRLPTDVAKITTTHVAAYQEDQLRRFSESTAAVRHRSLKVFFKWAVNEGEISSSPMESLPPPKVGQVEIPVIPKRDIQRLLKACAASNSAPERIRFEGRRDEAIVRLLHDTGLRLSEITGIRLEDIDTSNRVIHVTGKGNKGRAVRYGVKSAETLNRYLRQRAKHENAGLPNLWIGGRGAITTSGITQILRRRCAQAGMKAVRPHQFRHTFAAEWLRLGGTEGNLMNLAGWASREMLSRYGRHTAAERALTAHEQFSPGDHL
jgi:site-specific recombinase XerD